MLPPQQLENRWEGKIRTPRGSTHRVLRLCQPAGLALSAGKTLPQERICWLSPAFSTASYSPLSKTHSLLHKDMPLVIHVPKKEMIHSHVPEWRILCLILGKLWQNTPCPNPYLWLFFTPDQPLLAKGTKKSQIHLLLALSFYSLWNYLYQQCRICKRGKKITILPGLQRKPLISPFSICNNVHLSLHGYNLSKPCTKHLQHGNKTFLITETK